MRFTARDTRLGREVAIKVLSADRLSDPHRRDRYVQEARAASALNHTHIVTMIPGMSPLIMFLRIVVLTPPLWQIGLSIAFLVLGILGVVWVAARVYRVGILMYGKKPTFPQLLKWVRHA